MPTPNTPTLVVTGFTPTTVTVAVSGDIGVTNTLYYAPVGLNTFTQGPNIVGNGSLSLTGLQANAAYQLLAISSSGGFNSLPALAAVSLAAPTTVLQALVAKFQANPVLAGALKGGLYNGEVPENTDMPYGFVTLDRTFYQHYIADATIEISRVSFHVFALGAQAVEILNYQIKGAFDFKPRDVPFTDGTSSCIQIVPRGMDVQSAMARWKDGSLIYRGVVSYEVLTQRYP